MRLGGPRRRISQPTSRTPSHTPPKAPRAGGWLEAYLLENTVNIKFNATKIAAQIVADIKTLQPHEVKSTKKDIKRINAGKAV